jgi:hypothetical protein
VKSVGTALPCRGQSERTQKMSPKSKLTATRLQYEIVPENFRISEQCQGLGQVLEVKVIKLNLFPYFPDFFITNYFFLKKDFQLSTFLGTKSLMHVL